MKYRCDLPINENYLNTILKSRGITDIEEFLHPTKDNLLSPYDLDNIVDGAKLLIRHIDQGSNILLIVDSDQDGFTSAAMLYNYINHITIQEKPITFWLHNGKQHGLEDMIDKIEENPIFNLVILPDSSSNDYEYHKRLAELSIDCLVIDHHEAEKYSEYACVINNQLSKNYSNKTLSGAGVVYKFLQVLDDLLLNTPQADEYLDLAAVGLIGDMMDINNLETRYIICQGLSNIKNNCLEELINKQSFSIKDRDNITPTDVSFYITPLVNALIRVGRQSEKETLFKAFVDGKEMIPKISRNKVVEGQFESRGEQNARNCVNARSRQNRALDKAIEKIEFDILKNSLNDNKIIISEIDDDKIDSTLTGLLAMKIMAKYHKPVLLGRVNDKGIFKGSARGESKSALKDLRQFLIDSKYFEYAEGHAMAFGHSIPYNKIEAFTKYANEQLKDIDFSEGVYDVDFIINSQNIEILNDIIMELGGFTEIWGKSVEEPLIIIEDLLVKKADCSVCGSNNDTVRIQYNGVTYIAFKAKELIEQISDKEAFSITILGTPNINEWMGNQTPQIMIRDFEIANNILDF